jgi:hypothetical protein
MSDLPNVFIASSVEGLSAAEAVNIKLEYEARVKQWDNAFDLSSVTITSLIKRAKETDFGIFVFHKDDKTTIRGNTYSVVRDNVLFELGLFIGALGIEKCFVMIPKSSEADFRLPTDLAGLTTTTYDDELDDMVDAVATSCAKIKHAIKKITTPKIVTEESKSDSVNALLQQQLNATQSQLWSLRHDAEYAKEEVVMLKESIKNYLFSIAKPATEAEIVAWETGAKDSYLKEVKINRHNVYFIDKDVVIPPLSGADSISLIIEKGVKVHGSKNRSHNSIYYMDGFRTDGFV